MAARAFRALAATPISTLAATATLALGVAASTCVFTLLNALLLRPLPFAQPQNLAALRTAHGGVSWQDLRDLAAYVPAIDQAAVYTSRTWGYRTVDGRPPEVVLSGMVTADFFRLLGIAPQTGQGFDPEFEQRGANRVLWLTHEFWLRYYRGDPSITGQTAWLNDVPYRILGVLPAGFRFPMRGGVPEVYIPLDIDAYCCARDARGTDAVVRWKARADLHAVSARLAELYPTTNRQTEFLAEDLQAALAGTRRQPLLLLAAAVALLMFVAALNAMGILLARAAARAHEAAIRASLGAGLSQLVREHAAQGLWIGAGAAALGLAGAQAILYAAHAVPAVAQLLEAYARVHPLQPDWRVAFFCLTAAMTAAVTAAAAPALMLRQWNLESALRAMRTASAAPTAVRWRHWLVVTQVAGTVLLTGSGAMLLESLRDLIAVDPGFRVEQIISAGIGIPEARYDTDERMIAFHRQVIERLKNIPGVRAAGGGAGLPLGPMSTRILLDGETTPLAERPRVDVAVASPELPQLLAIPLRQGRAFSAADRWGAPRVLLVNQAFVSRWLAGRDPVGTRLRLGFYNGFAMKPWSEFEIIGVLADTRSRSPEKPPEPMVVLSSEQVAMEGFLYHVATGRDAASLAPEFQQAVWSIDRNIQAVQPVALSDRRAKAFEERKLTLWLLGWFAVLALVLAGMGLGAAAAAAVAERRTEIGIRSALGATPGANALHVVAEALRAAATGAAIGTAALLIGCRFFGAGSPGVPALTAALALVAVVMAAACTGPALTAARVDPAATLR